jgi:hypothetical protein
MTTDLGFCSGCRSMSVGSGTGDGIRTTELVVVVSRNRVCVDAAASSADGERMVALRRAVVADADLCQGSETVRIAARRDRDRAGCSV